MNKNAGKFSSTRVVKGCIGLLLILYLGACIYALFFYGSDVVTTMARCGSDEFHFLDNVRIMFDELCAFRIKGFLYNCYSFGYGIVYWILLFFATLPGFLLDNQRIIVFGGRLLSLIGSFGALSLVVIMLRRTFHANILLIVLSLIPVLLSLQLFCFQTIVHPETVYIFFIVLTMFFLYSDDGKFDKQFYLAGYIWTLAVSAKALALFSVPIWIVYFIYYRPKCHAFMKLLFVGIASFSIVNFPLIFPLIRIRFFNWLVGMGVKARGESLILSVKNLFFTLHDGYFNISALMIVCLMVMGYKIWQSRKSKIISKKSWVESAFISVFLSYLVIFVYCSEGVATTHYGLPMLYALPVILCILFREIKAFVPQQASVLQVILSCLLLVRIGSFSGSMLHVVLSEFCFASAVYNSLNASIYACEMKRDMDIALRVFKEHFSSPVKKRLIVRGNPHFGLIWPTVYMPPLYLSLYDLNDRSLIDADLLFLRVSNEKKSDLFFQKDVEISPLIKAFFEKIYDEGRLRIFKRKAL